MKREMILLLWVLASFHLVFAQNEVRKPSVEVFINGKMYQNGNEITVQKGQMLEVKVLQEGGRRDFVNYPDNYLKISPDLQVLSRGANRIVYLNKGIKSEWKLLSESANFSSDDQLTIQKKVSDSNFASVRVGTGDFSRTYIKVDLTTTWQFSAGEEQKLERNISEALIYLNIAGSTDTWFVSKNIHASGTKENEIAEKLNLIQSNFDSIEFNLIHLKYAQAQRNLRELQTNVNLLNGYLNEVKLSNHAFKLKIHFVGLPSDRPIADLVVLEKIQSEWARLKTFINQQNTIINGTSEGNAEVLKSSIQKYLDWQYSLPDNWLIVMSLYIPRMNTENIIVPSSLQSLVETNQKVDVSSFEIIKKFFDQRANNIELETLQITQTRSRLQAVKLFDGMLRSYISSINWAEWENNREVGFAYVK